MSRGDGRRKSRRRRLGGGREHRNDGLIGPTSKRGRIRAEEEADATPGSEDGSTVEEDAEDAGEEDRDE